MVAVPARVWASRVLVNVAAKIANCWPVLVADGQIRANRMHRGSVFGLRDGSKRTHMPWGKCSFVSEKKQIFRASGGKLLIGELETFARRTTAIESEPVCFTDRFSQHNTRAAQ